MKMKKQRSFLIIKIVLLTAVIGGLLYAMNAGAARLNQGQEAESMKQLENSIRKATMTCYATLQRRSKEKADKMLRLK